MKDTSKKEQVSSEDKSHQEEKKDESTVDQAVDKNETEKETSNGSSKLKYQIDQLKQSHKSNTFLMYIILSLIVAVLGYLVNQQMSITQYNMELEAKLAKLANPPLEFKMISKVGNGDLFVECPSGFTLLSCGINHSAEGHITGQRPFSSSGCVCTQNSDNSQLNLKYTCFAYCMKSSTSAKRYPLTIE